MSFPPHTLLPDRRPECHGLLSGASFQRFIRPAGFSALSPDYSLGRGRLTDRPWPLRSLGGRGGGFVMAALTRTSLTIFSRLVSDCQAERKLSLHNSLDLLSFSLLAAMWQAP